MPNKPEQIAAHITPRFSVHSVALQKPRAAVNFVELELIQGTQQKTSSQGELLARKVFACVARKTLMRSDRLSALLPTEPVTKLTVHVPDEGLSVEAIAQALSWQALPAEERQQCIDYVTWQSMCSLLQAAAWLGCAPLLAACEATLCELLRLDNVSSVSRAAAAPAPPASYPNPCDHARPLANASPLRLYHSRALRSEAPLSSSSRKPSSCSRLTSAPRQRRRSRGGRRRTRCRG